MSISTEEKYQQLQHREHIYKLPDTYIGSIEPTTIETFVIGENEKMTKKNITFVPGFFKIFDEVLVNAIDHKQRDASVKNIKITFEKGKSPITVMNDGNGIDVVVHQITNKYVPEMLFGDLLTSTNYNPDERRTTGGKNGYGSKLTNIFSKEFIVETVDANRQLKYIQKFSENNQETHPAKITKFTSKPYTKITFLPDYEKFNMTEGIDGDIYDLLTRRVYDTTAVTPPDLNIYLNGTKLKIKSMEKYVELFSEGQKVFYFEQERWKVGIILSPNREYNQISFVNGIWTIKGGRHVDYILNQIIDKVKGILTKNTRTKNKTIKTSQIKDNIWLFVDSIIENPSFTSQTKEELTTKISQFGSSCQVDEKWVEKWMKNTTSNNDSFIERMVENIQQDTNKSLKKTDGSKKSVIHGIPKLEDAFFAGTRNSLKCTLILTEGDSAKASVMSGLSVLGPKFRETYGVFPLRGKFINVRDISMDKVSANEEVKNIKTILGLQHGKVYTQENLKELRYGSIALTTDSDYDGSHIKGLVINFLHFYWPSLLQIDGFIKSYITPIVKGFSGNKTMSFYTLKDYNQFKDKHQKEKWNYKYYKGLGTSTGKEFKEYFSDIKKITREYKWDTDEPLIMAFSKSLANSRKEWLKLYNSDETLEYIDNNQILLSDFVHKDLKHFSNYDNLRSIPNAIDGLKPSQRKVIFGILKKNKGEIKVAQLASYISEQTSYHHGEVSLEQTIIGLAQDFLGKNNLPLLQPKGQFGTIYMGGKDHAQSRYIYTELFDYSTKIFNELDNSLLEFLKEEGKNIEPKNYYPILPMVLVNGSDGIGTGYSTYIPNFNPSEIRDEIIKRNSGTVQEFKKVWTPWYKGFKGKIVSTEDPLKFDVLGKYEVKENQLLITELPVGTWIQTYKEFLDGQVSNGYINSYVDKSIDESVCFEVVMTDKISAEKIPQHFKLTSKISLNNMYLYKDKEIHKFESVKEILDYFYEERLVMYEKRKTSILENLNNQLEIVNEKIAFIRLVLDEPDLLFRKTKKVIEESLKERQFKRTDQLLGMPIYWWTEEKILELECNAENLEKEIEILTGKQPQDLWTADLKELKF